MPLDHFGTQAFRAQVGVVMQDDQLLSGSLADNICFFDGISTSIVCEPAPCMAGIDEEIMAMPMNYNTLIGDMGTALSGGQRQRLLLARALYRQPAHPVHGRGHLASGCGQRSARSTGRLQR